MSSFASADMVLPRSLRGHLRSGHDDSRMAAMAPVVLLVLNHVHLMAPLGDMRSWLEIHG